jgi:succinate dehydrogenase flavin-adding protein (antitoxin of CptAB toxin-antitoxin module)
MTRQLTRIDVDWDSNRGRRERDSLFSLYCGQQSAELSACHWKTLTMTKLLSSHSLMHVNKQVMEKQETEKQPHGAFKKEADSQSLGLRPA